MDRQYPAAASFAWNRDIDKFIEPARSQQRRINQTGTVGRTDQYHRLHFFQTVHLGEDRIDHPLGHLGFAHAATACRDEAVDFVDEQDRRRYLPGPGKQARNLLLALAIPFGEKVA